MIVGCQFSLVCHLLSANGFEGHLLNYWLDFQHSRNDPYCMAILGNCSNEPVHEWIAIKVYILQNKLHFELTNEPVHEISNNVVCATSKTSDQPVHILSLIRAFTSRLRIL